MSITINILLVDDVEYSRELLRGVLLECVNEHELEIEVNFIHSSTGESILEQIAKNSVNLVYLDIELPDINGLDVLKEVRQAEPDIMVVMVSGESSPVNVDTAIKVGANGFIVKPFNFERIFESVQNYLKREQQI